MIKFPTYTEYATELYYDMVYNPDYIFTPYFNTLLGDYFFRYFDRNINPPVNTDRALGFVENKDNVFSVRLMSPKKTDKRYLEIVIDNYIPTTAAGEDYPTYPALPGSGPFTLIKKEKIFNTPTTKRRALYQGPDSSRINL